MPNRIAPSRTTRGLRWLLLIGTCLGVISLFLLATATANTQLFAGSYDVLLVLNGTMVVLLMALVGYQLWRLRRRLKQSNLVGPAGYVSMEDGCVGGFVQRGSAAAGEELSVIEMGGEGAASDHTRATEASVRGFWKAYRGLMGFR